MARREPGLREILEALRQYGKALPKRPDGEGWYTPGELATQEGISIPALKYRILQAEKQGIVIERAVGTMPDAHGDAKRAVFFRLKNGKGKP